MPSESGGSTARKQTVAAFMSALWTQRRAVSRTTFIAITFALASATLWLFQFGYSFETGDQLQYLLLPYSEIFPSFLPGDWFTWHTSQYHVSFAWLVRAVHSIAGPTDFARGIFAVHCANLILLGYAIWRLARALRLGLLEAAFCVLVFGCVRQVGLAGALLNHAGLVPADLALAPFLLACAAFCHRRPLALGCWLGLSGLLHANYAVLGPLVLFPLELVRARQQRSLRGLIVAGIAFAFIAAPSLVLLVGTFLTHDAAPSAVAVTLFVRSPHHYDLASMRADEFYFGALLILLSTPTWARLRSAGSGSEWLQLLAAMLATLLLGVIGSGLQVVSLARIFAWRMSMPLFALLLLGAGATLRDRLRERDWPGVVWFGTGCALLSTFAQTDPMQHTPWMKAPLWAAAMLVSFGVATAAMCRPSRAPVHAARRVVGVVSAALALGIAVLAARTPQWNGRELAQWSGIQLFQGRITLEPHARRLFEMIRAQTPEDASFLIPPGQQLFRLQARRAVFVDWKCAPMKGDEALEWQRRMLLSMGVTSFPARGYELPRAADALYNARPLSELAALARSEGLSHILVRTRNVNERVPGLHRLFSVGDYVVFAVEG